MEDSVTWWPRSQQHTPCYILFIAVWCHYNCHFSLQTLERIQFSVSYLESIFAFHEASLRHDQYLDMQKITFSFLCNVSCHFLSSLRYAKWQIEPLNQIKQINCLLVNHNQKAIWAVNAFNRVGKNRKGRKKGKWVKNEGKGNADEKKVQLESIKEENFHLLILTEVLWCSNLETCCSQE